VIGAAPAEPELEAPAWVEVDGAAMLETGSPAEEYVPLVAFDPAGRRVQNQAPR
jgi:hypothetical protein